MGILQLLFQNSREKARTLKPEQQSAAAGYRGVLAHELPRCTGCGTCAYVCSPGAIHLETQPDGIRWNYSAGACTFCARCAEYCPTQAISLTGALPQASAMPAEINHLVAYQPCRRCGQPMVPLPAHALASLSRKEEGQPAGPDDSGNLEETLGYCEKCRSRVTVQRWKDSLTGANRSDVR